MLFLNESTRYIDMPNQGTAKEVQEMNALVESMGLNEGIFDKYFSNNPEVAAVEILGEMNSAWDAIERDMILCESNCALKGIPLSESTLGKFWETVKKTFAKIWAAIRDAFAKAMHFIFGRFMNAKKWLDENIKNIDTSATVTIKGYDRLMTNEFASSALKLPKVPDKGRVEDFEHWLKEAEDKSFDKDSIRELIFGAESDKVSVNIAKCQKIINDSTKFKASIEFLQKEMAAECQSGIQTAEAAEKYNKDTGNEDTAKAFSAKIKCLKRSLAIKQSFYAVMLSAANQALSTAFSCAKKLLAKSKADKK